MTNKIRPLSGMLIVAAIIVLTASTARPVRAGPSHRSFEPDSLKTIERDHAGQAFLLVLWSLDCPPCRDELKLLSEFSQRHPDFNLVLVSTDSLESTEQLTNVLASEGLDKVESWVFSGAGAQRLRYEIDPDWYGEIPRSYFYDRGHQRTGLSGSLKTGQIEAWLDSVKTAQGRQPGKD
jgi:thiol-disulfide isomerase/thioredoxin